MKNGTRNGVAIALLICSWGIAAGDIGTAATVASYATADIATAVPQESIIAERKDVDLEVLELIQPDGQSFEIHEPNASFVKLHFSRFNIPRGVTVEVRSPDGSESYRYTAGGRGARTLNRKDGDNGHSGFSTMSIGGDTAIVEVHGKLNRLNSRRSRVHIDYFMAGYPEKLLSGGDHNSSLEASGGGVAKPLSICGIDERVPAACWEQGAPEEFDRSWPVARLLINGTKSCTAWRVGPENVLFTNNHCVSTQEALESVEVWFNYQAVSCTSNTLEPTVKVAADILFLTHRDLDFTLFSVQNFSAIEPFGYLGLDVRDAQLGERIYIPQHGYGYPKQIAIESDMNASGLCEVDDLSVDRYAPDTDIGYFCDAIGGSSGSPVLAGSSGRVIALHHFGGCENSGVKMSLIWPEISGFFGGQVPAGDNETDDNENLPPVAQFGFNCDETACSFNAGASADTDGTISGYTWTFGDGLSAAGEIAQHGYASAGSYNVKLTVVDNQGASDSLVRTISVQAANQPPAAAFQVSCNGLICTFNASASSDTDGTISKYTWSFGDGTSGTFSVPQASHTFAAGGQYSVQLKVTDNHGATATATTLLTVTEPVVVNQSPQASFTYSCQERVCDFNASGSTDPDGTIVSYQWNFGGSVTGSGAYVSRTFGADGAYEVRLTVVDNHQASSTVARIVQVASSVSPEINLNATPGKQRKSTWVDLEWSGAAGSIVDVFRDGSLLAATNNDGRHRDSTVSNRDKQIRYRLCERNTSNCSDEVTVTR